MTVNLRFLLLFFPMESSKVVFQYFLVLDLENHHPTDFDFFFLPTTQQLSNWVNWIELCDLEKATQNVKDSGTPGPV